MTNMAPDAAEAAWTQGNYSRAAFLAQSDELRGAALAMVGALEESLLLLEGQQTPRAHFARALALWGLGRASDALASLASAGEDGRYGHAANRLGTLLRRDKIRLLVQGRDDPRCPEYDLIGTLRKIPYAEVMSVGYSPHADVVIDYTSTLDDVLEQLPPGWQPDLYLNHLVEDNPPPYGIEKATFPTLFHSQDYDRHIQQTHGYLTLGDAVIALGATDHDDLSALSRRPTHVFPLLLGIDVETERRTDLPRTKDVYISGSLFNNGLGKARCVFEISQLPDEYAVDYVDGFVSAQEYYAQLGRAKATFTYVNRWGALNGRAVEAISVGTCALVQEGTELQLYVSPEQGAIPFREDNYLDVLKEVVRDWDSRYAAYGQAGVARVKEVFEFERCIRRYFNFLVALAVQVDTGARTPQAFAIGQPRYPTHSPWRIPFHFVDTDHVLKLQDQFRKNLVQTGDYRNMDALGESLLYSYLSLKKAERVTEEVETAARSMLGGAMRVYQLLSEQFPQRIASVFNFARLLYESKERAAAVQVFSRILGDAGLSFDAHDTLFWKELQDNWFDYDVLMEEGVAYRKDGDPAHLIRIERAIRESCAFYLGSMLLEDGQAPTALTVLNGLGEIALSPAVMLRAVLRFTLGDHAAAWRDVEHALSQRPWDSLQLDQAFFDFAKQAGCPVESIFARRARLMHRLRKVPKEWHQERPAVERFIGSNVDWMPSTDDIEHARQVIAAIEAMRAAPLGASSALNPSPEQQAVLSNAYRSLVDAGVDGVARLRWLTGELAGSTIGKLLSMDTQLESSGVHEVDDDAKRQAFLRRQVPDWLVSDPPLICGEAGWLSDGRILAHDAYVPLERAALLDQVDVLSLLRERISKGERVRILEIGAGYGALAALFAQTLPGCEYVIADWPEALAFSGIYLGIAFPEMRMTLSTEGVQDQAGFTLMPTACLPALVRQGVQFDLVLHAPRALYWSEPQARACLKLIRRLIGKQGMFFEQYPDPEESGGIKLDSLVRNFLPYQRRLTLNLLSENGLGEAYLWANTDLDELLPE